MTRRGGFWWLLAVAVLLLAGVVYVEAVIPYQRNLQAIDAIESAGGEYELEPRGPEWMRSLLGDEFVRGFDTIAVVDVWSESGRPLEDANLERLLRRIAPMEAITVLSLSNPATADEAFGQLSCLHNVEQLVLRGVTTGDGLAYVRRCESLEYLRIESPTVADQHLEHLSELQNLQELLLRCPEITDDGLRHIGAIPKLRVLYLRDCTQVDGSGLGHLQ